ncbi:MAG: hypothetical protein ACJAYJ_005239 [Saprospiraceae bacterium]|jgi:hypothetical protein
MASNENSFTDGIGNTPDWIELYNATDIAINLKDWQLSDDAAEPEKWIFPEIAIPAKGFLIVLASGDDFFDSQFWHSNFKLSKTGESLILSKPDGELVDFIEFDAQETDQSYGRNTDGGAIFSIFLNGSPGSSNNEVTSTNTFETDLNFSHQPGFYTQPIDLKIMTETSDLTLHYTTDGSIPTESDAIFNNLLNLNFDNQPTSVIANIATSKTWEKPKHSVETHHNIRVRAFKNGVASELILSGTFLISNEEKFPYSLPVVSISTNAENLFSDEKGIYVEGDNLNYTQSGRDWERPAHFAYFSKDGDLEMEQNIGIRIGGATTREAPQKTLKLYARSEYGASHFEFPFFGDDYDSSFKRLAVRTTMGDKSNRGFTDDFCQQLIENEVACDGIQRRFVIVLLNGEYWGIHSLREVVGEQFMARKADVDKDEIDYLFNEGEVKHGDNADYLDLIDYLQNHSLAEPDHFDFVASQVDLEKFIDYNIVQFALANDDWPNNNVKFWKTKNGQWRWVINDLDDTMRESNQSRWRLYFEAHRAHHTKWEELEWAFLLLGKLLENKDFRDQFISRFNGFMNSTMSPSNTIPLLDELADELRPEIKKHINRWHFPENESHWEDGIEEARIFLLRRPPFVLNEIFKWLGTPYEWSPNPAQDFIQLKVPENEGQVAKLKVFNSFGQVVFYKNIPLHGVAETLRLELPFEKIAGIYYFKLDIGRQIFTEKVGLF